MSEENNVIGEEHLEEDSGAHQVPAEFVREPFLGREEQEVAFDEAMSGHPADQVVAPEPRLPGEPLREVHGEVEEAQIPPGVAPLPPIKETEEGVLLDSMPVLPQFKRRWLLFLPLLFGCCICGNMIGLTMGWTLFPVEWDASEWHGAEPANLQPYYREEYLQALGDLYAFDNNAPRVQRAAGGTSMLMNVCELVVHRVQDGRDAEAVRLDAVAQLMGGCNYAAMSGEGAVDEVQSPTPAG